MAKNERTRARSPKNEWMDNPYLLEAAVEAAKNGHTHLPWANTFKRGWNQGVAFREYKCACAWVRRENLKDRAEQYKTPSAKPYHLPAKFQNVPQNSPDTLAAIALAEAVAAREREAAEREKFICKTPPKETFQQKIKNLVEFAKQFAMQLLYLLAMIPLLILSGTDYRHGGLFGLFWIILLPVGIALGFLRFLVVLCISLFTGTPLRENWNKSVRNMIAQRLPPPKHTAR